MTTTTLTLAEFLLARIREDEIAARQMMDSDGYYLATPPDFPGLAVRGRAPEWTAVANLLNRVLAECDVKRQIVEGMVPFGSIDDINAAEVLGQLLASVYADHPDYDETWRP